MQINHLVEAPQISIFKKVDIASVNSSLVAHRTTDADRIADISNLTQSQCHEPIDSRIVIYYYHYCILVVESIQNEKKKKWKHFVKTNSI